MLATPTQVTVDSVQQNCVCLVAHGATENEMITKIAQEVPMIDRKQSSDWPLFGPINLVAISGGDQFPILNSVYIKLSGPEAQAIADKRRVDEKQS